MGEFQRCKKIRVPVAIPRGGLGTGWVPQGSNSRSVVAIPHSGLRTIYPRNVYHVYYESPSHTVGSEQHHKEFLSLPNARLSPSHPVGSEPLDVPQEKPNIPCLHPTQWAQNALFRSVQAQTLRRLHPTQWAQNKLRSAWNNRLRLVSIPHCGLRTWNIWVEITEFMLSPSHPVGSERVLPYSQLDMAWCCLHPTQWAQNGHQSTAEILTLLCLHPTQWAQNTQKRW